MKPDEMSRLFTKLSHHRRYIMVGVRVEIRDWETHEFYIFYRISVLFLVQNLFYRGLKCMQTLNLNSLYTIIFKSARDSQVGLTLNYLRSSLPFVVSLIAFMYHLGCADFGSSGLQSKFPFFHVCLLSID